MEHAVRRVTCGTRRKARLRRMPMLVLDLSSIDGLEVEAGRDGGDRNIY